MNLNERAYLPDGCLVEDIPGYDNNEIDEGESRADYDYDRRFGD